MEQSGGRGNAVRAVGGAVTLAQPAAPAVAFVAVLILSPRGRSGAPPAALRSSSVRHSRAAPSVPKSPTTQVQTAAMVPRSSRQSPHRWSRSRPPRPPSAAPRPPPLLPLPPPTPACRPPPLPLRTRAVAPLTRPRSTTRGARPPPPISRPAPNLPSPRISSTSGATRRRPSATTDWANSSIVAPTRASCTSSRMDRRRERMNSGSR